MSKNTTNKKLANVIKGYVSKFDIEDISIFENDRVWFSGSLENWYTSGSENIHLLTIKKKLEKTNVVKSISHNNRRLFIFLDETELKY